MDKETCVDELNLISQLPGRLVQNNLTVEMKKEIHV